MTIHRQIMVKIILKMGSYNLWGSFYSKMIDFSWFFEIKQKKGYTVNKWAKNTMATTKMAIFPGESAKKSNKS